MESKKSTEKTAEKPEKIEKIDKVEKIEKSEKPAPQIKQGAIFVERKKTGHLRIEGMRGKFMGVMFDNDGVSDIPVSDETRKAIDSQFPKAVIVEL